MCVHGVVHELLEGLSQRSFRALEAHQRRIAQKESCALFRSRHSVRGTLLVSLKASPQVSKRIARSTGRGEDEVG
eukprot:scaffold7346_cov245-Pinguiococcus_pyrenoidosus.AAC.19